MIDKEFLQDYEQEMIDARLKFNKDAIRGDFSSCRHYFLSHWHNPLLPISRIHLSILYGEQSRNSIWRALPLSRSSVVSLCPTRDSEQFEKMHGFKVKEIPDIIDYIKTEGRLQFALRCSPLRYAHMDFLEPVLTQLRPPAWFLIPIEAYIDSEELKKSLVEFDALSNIKYKQWLLDWSIKNFGSINPAQDCFTQAGNYYALLRVLHYDELVDEIETALVDDINRYISVITAAQLLVYPLVNAMKQPMVASMGFISWLKEYFDFRVLPTDGSIDVAFPGEIGKFLFKRLVHSPPTLDACKQLIYIYEDQDVYEVAQALNKAISFGEPSVVEDKGVEVSTILRNVWENKGLQRKIIGIKAGVKVMFAAVGAVSYGLEGAGIGLLTSFGFDVADRLFKFKDQAISERIGKFFSSNYETIIYDFKKKYPTTASTSNF